MVVPVDSDVYYRGVFWNTHRQVESHLNQRAFDHPYGSWTQFVRYEHGGPYRKALSLNCGVGWVERALIENGAADRVVAVDCMSDLLRTARVSSFGYPIEFSLCDTNAADFPPGPYDLVVNHAAGHHIAYVDRVHRWIWRMLASTGGTMVTWDYTGPHRNQYSERMWTAALDVNMLLPAELRSPMIYPHMPTMLALDPTEAVHSELLLDTMSRYFRHRYFRRLGGPIAYLLLTHNDQLFAAPAETREPLVAMIIAADVAHIARHPEDSLFTFAISDPRPTSEIDEQSLMLWTHLEEEREAAARRNGGRYYAPTAIEARIAAAEAAAPQTPTQPTAYEVALRGPRFAAAVFIRALALKVPLAVPMVRSMKRLARRLAGRAGEATTDPSAARDTQAAPER